jgi:hypothetical protein
VVFCLIDLILDLVTAYQYIGFSVVSNQADMNPGVGSLNLTAMKTTSGFSRSGLGG